MKLVKRYSIFQIPQYHQSESKSDVPVMMRSFCNKHNSFENEDAAIKAIEESEKKYIDFVVLPVYTLID